MAQSLVGFAKKHGIALHSAQQIKDMKDSELDKRIVELDVQSSNLDAAGMLAHAEQGRLLIERRERIKKIGEKGMGTSWQDYQNTTKGLSKATVHLKMLAAEHWEFLEEFMIKNVKADGHPGVTLRSLRKTLEENGQIEVKHPDPPPALGLLEQRVSKANLPIEEKQTKNLLATIRQIMEARFLKTEGLTDSKREAVKKKFVALVEELFDDQEFQAKLAEKPPRKERVKKAKKVPARLAKKTKEELEADLEKEQKRLENLQRALDEKGGGFKPKFSELPN